MRNAIAITVIVLLTLVTIAVFAEHTVRIEIGNWAKTQGYHVYDRTSRMRSRLLAIPGRLLHQVEVPHLRLDVKLKHMQRILGKRREALAAGLLETGSRDMVPGALTVGGRTVKVKLRLKGDWTDHLMGDKWSYRIEVRGDEHVFGMRRFSIQAPETRGYQGEPVYFRALQALGVVVPRYRFVEVTLNGTRIGRMALEEHVGRELLEHSERRDSAIVQFDESLVFHGVDDYRVAPIIVFEPGRLAKSPSLSAHRDTARALLHGFVRGTLRPSQVFRVDELAAYLAAAELFGSHHCLRWHNLRFYFDPVYGRLGPIGYDGNLHERQLPTTSVTDNEPIVRRMLADPLVREAFQKSLSNLCGSVLDGSFIAPLRELDRRLVRELQADYLMLDPMRWQGLVERARLRVDTNGGDAQTHRPHNRVAARHVPLHARAWLVTGDNHLTLELANALDKAVQVTGLVWRKRRGPSRDELSCGLRGSRLPLKLAPQRRHGATHVRSVQCDEPPGGQIDAFELVVETRLGNGTMRSTIAIPAPPVVTRPPVPSSTVAEQLRQHAFLSLDPDGVTLRVKTGDWLVDGSIIVPFGNKLSMTAGTRLQFAAHGALVAHGPVHISGEAGRPVDLGPADGIGWRGVAVLDPGVPVAWRHATVRNTTGVAFPGWQLTGGVSFIGADVILRNVTLDGSTAEDALNVVGGSFELNELRVMNTRSDAFDADFANGTVHKGEFTSIGGDAIDVSGSVVEVDGTRFDNVRDKALSIGERSSMRARGVHIGRAGTGAASKDGSLLELRDATIDAAEHFALAAYIKKPEFGVAEIRAERVRMGGSAVRAVAQLGSTIVIDGVAVVAQDLDVDALYASIMQKDVGR
ncbi:MAG: hypothetical protein ACJAYX_002845 [Planctomycetota bacterium]